MTEGDESPHSLDVYGRAVARDKDPSRRRVSSSFPQYGVPWYLSHSSCKLEREVHTLDWGTLSVLGGDMADEIKRRGVSDEHVPDLIREQLDVEESGLKRKRDDDGVYFNSRRANEAEAYLRDMVYGGVDGYAYVRSLAQFLKRPKRSHPCMPESELELGMSVARWVEQNVVNPLTDGQHAILKETSRLLKEGPTLAEPTLKSEPTDLARIRAHVHASEYVYPLIHLRSEKIDLGTLIRQPDEVSLSEEVWEGKKFKKREVSGLPGYGLETPEELEQVLGYVGEALRVAARNSGSVVEEESEEMKRIRLNLLALAKRVPVSLIALAPESIRGMVQVSV